MPSYPSHISVPVNGGAPPGLHCAVKRFCSGVNGQASQLSPRVFLQPDAAVVQHSFAGVWKFSSQDSLQPDAAVVQHSCAAVWQLSPREFVWHDVAVVQYSCASILKFSLVASL